MSLRAKVSDGFDVLIERRGALILVVIGSVSVTLAILGYARILPHPFSVPRLPASGVCVGCPRYPLLSFILGAVGAFMLARGLSMWIAEARNRDRERDQRL